MTKKPLVVIVSGAPGSGKSTLARNIAQYMMLPHIERDTINHGIELTTKGRVSRPKVGIPRYYQLLGGMIGSDISFITDGTIYRGVSEADLQKYLTSQSFAVNVHARAKNEHQRFYEREMNREGHSSDWVDDHMKVLDAIYEQTVDPLDLGIPIIEVDTNDGYNPAIADIVAQLKKLYDAEAP